MYTFKKSERLCNRSSTEKLYSEGSSCKEGALRLVYLPIKSERRDPLKVQIVVPKRHIAKAVNRNLIKRYIRESVRNQKKILTDYLELQGVCLDMSVIYQSSEIKSFLIIDQKINSLLIRLKSKL
jgi:ribonuclease P protein component